MPVILAWLLMAGLFPAVTCHGLSPPSPETVQRPFAPVGRWAGHWGVDIGQAIGRPVHVLGPGVVSFVGVVVANRVVTVDHGGGLRSSYSYLSSTVVHTGEMVGSRSIVGTSGLHDGRPAYHLSLRIAGRYIDPMALGRCAPSPWPALYLAMGDPYPRGRARHTRRNVRPSPHRPSRGCDVRARTTRPRGRAIRPSR